MNGVVQILRHIENTELNKPCDWLKYAMGKLSLPFHWL